MPARPADVADRRSRIDAAAIDVFASRGFSAATTAEIASKAKVAEGTIFRHYPTKKSLLLGVLEPVARRVIAPLASRSLRRLLKKRHGTLRDFLEDVFDDRLKVLHSAPPMMRVFLQEVTLHPDVRDLAVAIVRENIAGPFGDALDELKGRGLLDPDLDTATAMRLIMSTYGSYFMLRGLLFPDQEWDDDRERQLMVAFLARGLSPEGAT